MGGRRQEVEGTHLGAIEAKIENDGARRTNQSIGEIHVQKRKRIPGKNKLIVRMTKTKTKKASEKLVARKTKTKNE